MRKFRKKAALFVPDDEDAGVRLIIRAFASVDDASAPYGCLTLTPRAMAYITLCHEQVVTLRNINDAATSARFTDKHMVWIGMNDTGREFDPVETYGELGEVFDANSFLVEPTMFYIPEFASMRTEMDAMVCDGTSVWWTCTPRHAHYSVESDSLSITELTEALDAALS